LTLYLSETKITNANIRYISGGRKAHLERFTIPNKFVTAERNAISNAARNIPSPLGGIIKKRPWINVDFAKLI